MAKKKVRLEERIVDGISTTGKECTKCGEWKPLDNFRKDKRKSCGRGARCKQCTSVDNKKYYQNNGDVRRNYHKQNREVRLIQMRRYREENKRRSYITQKRWREENRESLSSQKKAYYDRNKMEIRQKRKEHYNLKKDEYYLAGQRRRARKFSLPDTLIKENQDKITISFKGNCAITDSNDFSWDHAIPLSIQHGGTTLENIYPLRRDLNISKSDGNIFEWFDANRERFNLSQHNFGELIAYLADLNGLTTDDYREYVYWCHSNPRDLNDDGELYYVNGTEHFTERDEMWAEFTDRFADKDEKETKEITEETESA